MSRRQAVWCAFACAALVRLLYLIVARPQFQSSTATVRDRRGWRAAGRSWARCHRGCGTTSAARPVDLHVVVHADSDLRGRKYLAAPWRRSARCPLWCVALTFVAVHAIFFFGDALPGADGVRPALLRRDRHRSPRRARRTRNGRLDSAASVVSPKF